MVGEGVVARWSVSGTASVENAIVVDGSVFTCTDGERLDRHGYATAGYQGRLLPEAIANPAAINALHANSRPWILVGHRDGRLSALPV
ncbi:hypothetical protein QLQ12_37575 [Actinoplanes sp. NEAU-A12]|uniref:Uncharacterized protein n=1 Tax=Actinoplanes sandaracinus TaxID=3045177 RepID=A0ABT6WX54_9ACTN|nr:hypothetical protein [Actinoplanes sandaracinus]MDI6104319.1 hypothetical protein [Actinoplanes sandaracinus]